MTPAERRHVHVPVMPREVLQWLQLAPGLTVLDGTVGAGGHSSLILNAIGATGWLVGIDRDPMMLQLATSRLQSEHPESVNYQLIQGSYVEAASLLPQRGIPVVDRVLLDLGLSSDQLADRDRGFGFDAGGPLDMRFHQGDGLPASELLKRLTEEELTRIFSEYGEEPAAGRIAVEIVRRRQSGQVVGTAEELAECVRSVVNAGKAARGQDNAPNFGRNPATKVFQALRIATNRELQHVEQMVSSVLGSIVKPGGIVVILTFHSLEDRIVKTAFKGQHGWQVLTKTPLEATPAEVRLNPRSRSAKLRAVRKV